MTASVLDIRDLSKAFGALPACDAIALDLRPGEIHALIGPNGAGKSTLINLIAGELKPDAGTLHLNGQDITSMPPAQRARMGLGRTFQISALALEHTVLENAVLGALGRARRTRDLWRPYNSHTTAVQAAQSALNRVGLDAAAGAPTATLSHGERRRLEVAIAMALEPRLYLMDEPMAGLGLDGTQAMTALLDKLRGEAPILLIEHDMDAVFALADRISVLVYGKVIATGTVDQIRTDPQVQAAYLGEEADTL